MSVKPEEIEHQERNIKGGYTAYFDRYPDSTKWRIWSVVRSQLVMPLAFQTETLDKTKQGWAGCGECPSVS